MDSFAIMTSVASGISADSAGVERVGIFLPPAVVALRRLSCNVCSDFQMLKIHVKLQVPSDSGAEGLNANDLC